MPFFKKFFSGLFIIILFYSAGNVVMIYSDQINQKQINEDLGDKYQENKFTQLMAINKNTVAWIKVPNTSVDYPVVKYTDNEFYLDKDFFNNKSDSGSIFMDYRNTGNGDDRNIINYGQHTLNGNMFKKLEKNKKKKILKENTVFYLDTPNGEYKYQIFSVYVTDNDFDYRSTDFFYDQHFESFLNEIKNKSYIPVAIEIGKEDRIITLSTCSYEFNGAKLVIHAKKIY